MSLLRRVVTEPLFQFIVIGAALFGLYTVFGEGGEPQTETPTIVVTPGRIAHLSEVFSRTWQRPPTPDELEGLIDAYIKEEVYYREGRRLGLDLDDTIVRRRLQQKMEFLLEPGEDQLSPKPGELEDFLKDNAFAFRFPEEISFQQVYFDPQDRADAEADAEAALAELIAGRVNANEVGDATLLPGTMPLSTPNQIAGTFGGEFLDGLEGLPDEEWSGPISSTFGLHLVRIGERQPARDPELAEVLEDVTQEWRTETRLDVVEERYQQILEGYEIVVEEPATDAPEAGGE